MTNRDILSQLVNENNNQNLVVNLEVSLLLSDCVVHNKNLEVKTVNELTDEEVDAVLNREISNHNNYDYVDRKCQENALFRNKIELDMMCLSSHEYHKNHRTYSDYVSRNLGKDSNRMLLMEKEFNMLFHYLANESNITQSFRESSVFFLYVVLLLHEITLK